MLDFEVFHGIVRVGHVGHSMRTGIDDSFVFGKDFIKMFVLLEHVFGEVNKVLLRGGKRAYEWSGNQKRQKRNLIRNDEIKNYL